MNQKPIRVGVVGVGAVAQSVHLPLIRRRPELFELVAIMDISPSLLAGVGRMFGVPESGRFESLDTMLDTAELDAIVICSGGSHEGVVVSALRRGLAVLCEKPLAVTHHELETISELAAGLSEPRLMVGYMKQYDPAVARAAELLEPVDDIRTIDVTVLHPTGKSQLDFARLLSPADDADPAAIAASRADDARLRAVALGNADEDLWRVYAGCLMSSLSHDMSVIRRLVGSPESVEYADIWRMTSSRQVRETGRDRGLGDPPPSIRAAGVLTGETRYVMDWHYLHDYPAYRETVRIVHGAGSLEIAFPSPYLLHAPTVLTRYDLAGDAEAKTEFRSIAESFELELEAFADMVRTGAEPLTAVEGSRQDVVTSQAIISAYAKRTGTPVGGEIGALG